jgi:chlorobactene glucosyltransferase
MCLGIYITWLVHSRSSLDIVVYPQSNQEVNFPEGELPLISVIIPARNERRNIRRCMQALLGQTYQNYEIIVIDDR